MAFTPKTPYLTTMEELQDIVLIKRKYPPLGLALPGGFVEIGEKVENACLREMKEEISLDVEIRALLRSWRDHARLS